MVPSQTDLIVFLQISRIVEKGLDFGVSIYYVK